MFSICPGDSIQILASPSVGVTYQWYKNAVIVPDSIFVHFWAKEAGSYTVVVSGCVTPSVPIVVRYKDQPVFTITSNTDPPHICAQQTIQLTVHPSSNTNWGWMAPPSVFLTNTNPLTPPVLFSTTTFQVVGSDNSSGCTNSASFTVIVDDIIDGGVIQSDQAICAGTSATPLTSVSLATGGGGPGTYTYSWKKSTDSQYGPWTLISGATQPDYSPGTLNQTTWFIRYADSGPCSSGNSNTVMITVNAVPSVTSASSKAICSGTRLNYQPTADVDFTSYSWTASSGTVAGITPSGTGLINDLLTLPSGSSTSQTITYTITPTGPAPTLCVGTPFDLVVTVNPTPTVTNATLTKEICAGGSTDAVTFQSNVALTTFSWTASATSGLAGYRMSGTGDLPEMQIYSPLLDPGTIIYTVTPHSPAPANCDGPFVSYVITVKPAPSVINIPMDQTICSGQKTVPVVLTSNKPDPVFSWNATASNVDLSGFTPSGTNTIPEQTLTNGSSVQRFVSYTISIEGNFEGCVGTPMDYKIYVNPIPSAIATGEQSICSGVTTDIALTSSVENTAFRWTASAPSSITGFSNNSGLSIAQPLTNSSNEPQDVTYIITPSSEGCDGTPITVVVTVFPSPALTTTPLTKQICSGSYTAINLTGTPAEANFSWTITGTGVSGYSIGSGTTIDQTLINNTNSSKNVVYDITTSANGCSVHSNYTVVVNPIPAVTNSPLLTSICSGTAFNLPLTSNVTGTTFNWSAVETTGVSGQSNGTGTTINQTLVNGTNSTGTVTYTITPIASKCTGTPVTYTVTVNPVPAVNLSMGDESICSGATISPVTFSTGVPGTIFTWSATPSGSGISGYTSSGSGSIPSKVISNSFATQRTVTYTVTPYFDVCAGPNKIHVITVNPLPSPSISGSSSMCAGSTGNVYTTQPGMSNYIWSISGGSITADGESNSSNATVTWNTAGTQSISVNYTDPNGCTALSPGSRTVTVKQIPVGTAIPASIAVCSEQQFTINLGSSMGSDTTYSWSLSPTSLSGLLSGASNPISASYVNIGTIPEIAHFTIIPTDDGCPGLPFNADVTVNPLPEITISGNTNTATGATEIYTTQSGMTEYSWTLNPSDAGTIISGGTTNAVSVSWISTLGQLSVNYKNTYGCNASENKCITVNASAVPATFDVIPENGTFCEGATEGEGTVVGLSNSQGNIKYELIRDNGVVWDTKIGTSGAFDFSRPVNVAGTYRIKATNTLSDMSVWMNRMCVVTEAYYPIYSISSSDQHFCSGDHNIGISGSETDVKYWLMLNGNQPDTISLSGIQGTGLPNLDFGNPIDQGSYRIYASKNG